MIHDPILEISSALAEGSRPDLHPTKGAFLYLGTNVMSTQTGVEKMKGWSRPFTSGISVPVRGLHTQLITSQRIFFGTSSNLYQWNSATVSTLGSSYTGSTDDSVTNLTSQWSFVDWGTWVIATNGKDAPQVYKGTSFAALGGTPPSTMRIIKKLGPYVLGFNTATDPKGYAWCHADDVEQWVPSSSNSAGDLIIRELNSEIKAAQYLGTNIAVYGTNSMAIVGERSAPYYFGHNIALTGIGAVSQNAVVSIGRLNYGLSREGFWKTDGVSYKYIDEPVIRKYLQDDINWNKVGKICSYHNQARKEVIWYYQSVNGSDCDKGVSYNYETDSWNVYSIGRTACTELNIFKYAVTATAAGAVYLEDVGSNADDIALPASVETLPIAFYNEDKILKDYVKYVEAVDLGMPVKTGTVYLEIGMKNRLEDSVVTWKKLLVDDPTNPVPVRLSARWFIFKVTSTDLNTSWEIQTMTVYGKVIGRVR